MLTCLLVRPSPYHSPVVPPPQHGGARAVRAPPWPGPSGPCTHTAVGTHAHALIPPHLPPLPLASPQASGCTRHTPTLGGETQVGGFSGPGSKRRPPGPRTAGPVPPGAAGKQSLALGLVPLATQTLGLGVGQGLRKGRAGPSEMGGQGRAPRRHSESRGTAQPVPESGPALLLGVSRGTSDPLLAAPVSASEPRTLVLPQPQTHTALGTGPESPWVP